MVTFFTHRSLISSITVLLLALLSYQLALVVWHYSLSLDQQPFVEKPLQVLQTNTQGVQLSSSQLARRIINAHPFGKAQEIKVTQETEEKISAPETKLNYKLRGIYFSDNDSLSSAIIELNNKDALSYAINDVVEDGIVIHTIHLKHIVLDRYGKYETLTLEEIKFDKKNKIVNVLTKSASNIQHNQLLKSYRKRFVNNPMALAKKFRSVPVTENGKTIGFRLKAVRGETLLKKLNVPANAVFTSINGVGLDKPFQALDALKSLQTAKSVNVTYLLNGIEQSRDFEL